MDIRKSLEDQTKTTTIRENEEDQGLYSRLSAYGKSDYYPYHMPGHKRNVQSGRMGRYYDIDITEIDGFDNLHHAEGILQEAQERANRLYGAGETFYLVNGSTCGVLAAIMAVVERGGELLMARNCHKSVYHAAIMQELNLHYYDTPILEEYGIYDGIAADGIEQLLNEFPECKAVVVTSPTYEGILSDIRALADVVHRRESILIVDEAHGAHLGLSADMPEGAVAKGADLVIHSLHKTLPSMTQTALIHVQGDRVDRKRLRRYLGMLQTSSPSYVMMASMDSCVRYLESHGAQRFAFMKKQYVKFCKRTERCTYIKIGKMTQKTENCRTQAHMAGWDMGKLVIFVKNAPLSGQQLYDILREEYHLQMEMAAVNYVIAIMTIMDTAKGWQRLADALVEIDDRIETENIRMRQLRAGKTISRCNQETKKKESGWSCAACGDGQKPEIKMKPSDAFNGKCEEVPLSKTVGRVIGDFINLYPPGVPLLVPGEVMNASILGKIQDSMRMGLNVQGVSAEGKVSVVV